MDYVCLAAGRGTRMGDLGRYLQKCMYPIGLRPFLEYSTRNLLRSRALDPERDRLVLVVGHHGEQVRRYFGAGYDGLEIVYLEQRDPLGTGHALQLVADAFTPSGPVVAWLADLYVPGTLFERVHDHPTANVQTLAPAPAVVDAKLRVTVEGERVITAWRGEGDLVDIGLWKFTPDTLEGLATVRNGEYRVLPNLQRLIEAGSEVGFVRAEEWLHLGGTEPSAEENVRGVVGRVLELEGRG